MLICSELSQQQNKFKVWIILINHTENEFHTQKNATFNNRATEKVVKNKFWAWKMS